MRIAICHHYSLTFGSGGERLIVDLARYLKDQGHQVDIYCIPFRKGPDHGFQASLEGIGYHESWLHHVDADVAYVLYVPIVHKAFRINCPKIAGIHNFMVSPEIGAPELLQQGLFDLIREHGPAFTMLYYYSRIFAKPELASFDGIHSVNPAFDYSGLGTKFYSIPNWVEPEVFKPSSEKDPRFTILYVGRHTWSKGFDNFLRIAERLKEDHPEFKFICTGEGNDLVEGVGYVDNQADMARLYSRAHVLLYPSRCDSFGLVIIESMACGTPVVTSEIPSHVGLNAATTCTTDEEYISSILSIYERKEKDPDGYQKESSRCREVALKYSKGNILSKFEKMLLDFKGT